MYQRRDIFTLTSKRTIGEIGHLICFDDLCPNESARTESSPFVNELSEILLDKTPKAI